MTSNEKKRYWLYARVSSERPRPSDGGQEVDAQLNRLRQYTSDKGWEIAGEMRSGKG